MKIKRSIEILITVTIFVVLILFLFLTAARFFASRSMPKSALAIPKMIAIESAIEYFHNNTGRYPEKLEDLLVCPEGLENIWNGPYLQEKQLLDPWKNKYIFEYGYRLKSLGADGIKGGEDENTDKEEFIGLN